MLRDFKSRTVMIHWSKSARFIGAVAIVAVGIPALAATPEGELRLNYFNDPFFKVASGISDCPEPLGPRVTEQERNLQSRHRAERGTTCYLTGECDKPNAYAYDSQISEVIAERWGNDAVRASMSIWVTVQARVVYFEGCADAALDIIALESFARSISGVQ